VEEIRSHIDVAAAFQNPSTKTFETFDENPRNKTNIRNEDYTMRLGSSLRRITVYELANQLARSTDGEINFTLLLRRYLEKRFSKSFSFDEVAVASVGPLMKLGWS